MLKRIVAFAGIAAASVGLLAGTAHAAAAGFTVRGSQILRDGQPWVPYGFTISTFQDGIETKAANEQQTVDSQLDAIKGAWHGNVVRFQIEQYEWLNGGGGITKAAFRAKVTDAISYAESLGLAVVINDQTEGQDGFNASQLPKNPTAGTVTFWQQMEQYRSDPDVIIDPFNEPRLFPSGFSPQRYTDYYYVPAAGSGYVGLNQLIRSIRADGFTQQLWVEVPGNSALAEVVAAYPRYTVTSDVLHNVVYSYHHTEVDMNGVPTYAGFDAQFGNLVTQRHLPVVDGEWTNRSVPSGNTYKPSGDVGQCWGNAPKSVPAYLSYLRARGIGMTVWTLGSTPTDPSRSYINADGQGPDTANNYSGWTGCVSPHVTRGAGQLIMNWYASATP